MQSDVILIFVVLGLAERKTINAAAIPLTTVLFVRLLVKEHVEALIRGLQAPAHRNLPKLTLVQHRGV